MRARVARGVVQRFVQGDLGDNRVADLMPLAVRVRSVVIQVLDNPLALARLSDEERQERGRAHLALGAAYRKAGLRAIDPCVGMGPEGYADGRHFSEVGGGIVAEQVAPLVRQITENP